MHLPTRNNFYLFYLVVFLLLIGIACKTKNIITTEISKNPNNDFTNVLSPLNTIAFGSCNKVDLPQTMWPIISQNNPDLWMWLGDIIYADTENMSKMRAIYDAQKSNSAYSAFTEKHPIIGIWDDHDYGQNDGGKSYRKKKQSKLELLRFLDVSQKNPVWKREGAYQSYTFGQKGKRIKVIILDTRYFRDRLRKDIVGKNRYRPNKNGTLLGSKQWKWLEKQLKNSDADIHLIASSIQVIPMEHRFEQWSNFPNERNKLFKLLIKTKPSNTIFISGDRHSSEISKIKLADLDEPIYEVTSSSLTHAYRKPNGEPNRFRVGNLVDVNNFALLKFDWSRERVGVKAEIRGDGNVLLEEEWLSFE